MSWTTTVTIPATSILELSTQAGGCKAQAPLATVTINCPFTYPVDCPN